jgi:precorrin-8X/cobalt-precorrin-8 methylmutase
MKPHEITNKSFDIIRNRLEGFRAAPAVMELVIRIAHATGDVEFARQFIISEEAVQAGVRAVRSGCSLVTDVEMVRAGIRKDAVERFGGSVECFLNDPEVREQAQARGTTRSEMGMRRAASLLQGGIAVIGNAPTALFTVCELVEQGDIDPALVIGVPVGFVGAAESKQKLAEMAIPYITVLGERGGSTIAAAIVNGVAALAGEESGDEESVRS